MIVYYIIGILCVYIISSTCTTISTCICMHITVPSCILSVVIMIFPALLWLLLTNLVGVSSQQTECTRDGFQATAVELLHSSVGSESIQQSDLFINETYYNCLATSETIGEYTTMSVSLLYTILNAPDTLREIRYVMACIGDTWSRRSENNTALRSNETRTDCYECTVTADNEDYCSREYRLLSILYQHSVRVCSYS